MLSSPDHKKTASCEKDRWINPLGSFGDMLMLSGVLKQCIDADPLQKYCLVRRTAYTEIFRGHPAIQRIGFPPKNEEVISTGYWFKEKVGVENQRPYQILARMFGLKTPVEEKLYFPGTPGNDNLFFNNLPFGEKPVVVIAPSSFSPRKMMKPSIWHNLVEQFKSQDMEVIQVGLRNEVCIQGAFSLLGLTNISQLLSVLEKSDIILSVDNFILHAAHLLGKPAIGLWGPTQPAIYGYSEHMHIQCDKSHCNVQYECLRPGDPENTNSPCPIREQHCMNSFDSKELAEKVLTRYFA
jgi:ADP-heptose:LPS heptosyltransferase